MIGFLLSPIGRWLAGATAILVLLGGIYIKGRSDGKDLITERWKRAEQAASDKATKARREAEGEVPDIPPGPKPASSGKRLCDDRFDRDCH